MSATGTPLLAAWPPGTDPAVLRRAVSRAHEEFLTTGRFLSPPRDVVRDSWRRSRGSGVDPDRPAPAVGFAADDLRAYRECHPLAAVLPVIRRLLVETAQDSEQVVAVGDARARLMWVEGNRALRSRAESIGFVEGAQWAEEQVGTNAPGTAVAVGLPLQIYASEHFSRPVHAWSCAAAPVHDPDTGELLGVVDLTGGDPVAAPHALALVRATVAAAEAELRLLRLTGTAPSPGGPGAGERGPGTARGRARAAAQPSGEASSGGTAARAAAQRAPKPAAARRADAPGGRLDVLGRDRAIFTAPHGAAVHLSPRHSEIVFLLTRHPRGLTADALGLLLHEEEAARVTVRAEMSRLRRLLGPHVLGSRPYRLLLPVATDAGHVRGLLDRGAHRRALAAYPGPVLPRSEAPGVVEERDDLSGALRHALLHRADPALLLAWLNRPENSDDAEALHTALRCLPPGSPRRALVHARLERAAAW
jgi:GAF domain